RLHLVEFKATTAEYKGGGIVQSSPLAAGRRLVNRRFASIVDSWEFILEGAGSQDASFEALATLIALLEEAADYWTDPRQKTPVWIERKADNETNKQYAFISQGRVPEIPDVYGIEFDQLHMLEMTLTVEHDHWRSTQPGEDGTAVPIVLNSWRYVGDYEAKLLALAYAPDALWPLDETSGTTAANATPAGSTLDGTYNNVNLNQGLFVDGSPAALIADAPSFPAVDYISLSGAGIVALFDWDEGTFLAWVMATTTPYGDTRVICDWQSSDGDNRLYCYVDTKDDTIYVEYKRGGTVLTAQAGNVPLYEWTAVTITWSASADRLRLYVDRTMVQELADLPSFTDALLLAYLGASIDSDVSLFGLMSHAALWDTELTQAQVEEVVDLGTTQTTSTGEDVHIANAATSVNLTHVYTYDASIATFSANLAYNEGGFNLLPATVQANDYVAFARAPALPFNNLVFLIDTPGAGYTITWQYSTGTSTWASLTPFQDHTNQLKTAGVVSLHFNPPSAWAAGTVNSVSAYWIRGLVSAPSSPTTPTQDLSFVYTTRTPYVEILAGQITGDLDAQARIMLRNRSHRRTSTALNLFTNRVICGLRSYVDDDLFNAYINLSDRDRTAGVVNTGTNMSFTTDITAPTGRRITWAPTGATALQARVIITFGPGLAPYYHGRFHAYIRATQSAGNAGDIGVQLRSYDQDSSTPGYVSTIQYFVSLGTFELLDMGEVVLGQHLKQGEVSLSTRLEIWSLSTSGTPDLYLYDVILMPVDEWFADLVDKDGSAYSSIGNVGDYWRTLDIDGITYPKAGICRATIVGEEEGGAIITLWRRQSMSNEPIFRRTRGQRLWFLCGRLNAANDMRYEPAIVHTVRAQKSQRYLIHRGSR
ncbi:LamG-like jellyroll fold domain-containing protein, partial [Staphylococcus aureus]|uniref:LamG-like jellyroll fold domain-containing protein n=1 Tax=Staphylococcus aureus TaxID=1280 RepID=UPI0023AF3B33